SFLLNYYELAFLQGNTGEMERCLSAAIGTGSESALLSSQSDTEAYYGRLTKSRDLSQRAIDAASRSGAKETAALLRGNAALLEAEFGNTAQARRQALSALQLASTTNVQIVAALALARAGDVGRARALAESLRKGQPSNTLVNNFWVPSVAAAIALFHK